jgi:hypothetical protein
VAYATSARSKCKQTNELIERDAIRFTHTTLKRGPGGKNVERHFSVEGMIQILTRKEALRKKLAANILGIELLTSNDQKTVRFAVDKKMVEEARRLLAPAKIMPPTQMPWTCNRCGQKYEQRSQCATRHANDDKCKTKRKKRRPMPSGKPCKQKEYGRPRKLTWLKNIHAVLRKTTEIRQEKYDGCHRCHHRRKQCERCYFLEWMKVAQDPKEWDKIVYNNIDGDNVVGRRRQQKWDPPTEAWVDPRKDEINYYGGLLHIAGGVRR